MWKKLLFIPVSIVLLCLFAPCKKIHASDFQVEIDRMYTIDTPTEIRVTEKRKVTNLSQNRIISRENNETFQIAVISDNQDKLEPSYLSAKTYIDGNIAQNQKGSETKDSIDMLVPYGSGIGINQSKEFEIEYVNYGLIKQTGALIDIFVPGFGKDFKFETENTTFIYKTTLFVRKSLGEIGFVVPLPSNTSVQGDYEVYEISQESLLGSNIWIQVGNTQYYQFTLNQKVQASDVINKGYFNEYRLVIPRDIVESEIQQEVFFDSISPVPKEVFTDDEGNLIAVFNISSHLETTITVKGYATVKRQGEAVSEMNSGDLSYINRNHYLKYLEPAQYWEVGHLEIIKRAEELKGQNENIYKIVESNYSHIIETINYSEVKRFGINDRQGALKTLQGGAAVCMEYSDLFLTLTRAQGIPARAVFGYGYDARLEEQGQDAHQWVQVFIPQQNQWISVDVTWGESGPALIGGDLNHFYTHVAAIDPNTPPSIERTSYGKQVELVAPEFDISALEVLSDTNSLTSQEELLTNYPVIVKNEFQNVVDDITLRIQTLAIPGVISRNAIYIVYAGIGLIIVSGVLFFKLLIDILLRKGRKA